MEIGSVSQNSKTDFASFKKLEELYITLKSFLNINKTADNIITEGNSLSRSSLENNIFIFLNYISLDKNRF